MNRCDNCGLKTDTVTELEDELHTELCPRCAIGSGNITEQLPDGDLLDHVLSIKDLDHLTDGTVLAMIYDVLHRAKAWNRNG